MFTYLLTMRLARTKTKTKRGTGLYAVDDELKNSVYVYNKDSFLDFYISCVVVVIFVVSCHICVTFVNMLPSIMLENVVKRGEFAYTRE